MIRLTAKYLPLPSPAGGGAFSGRSWGRSSLVRWWSLLPKKSKLHPGGRRSCGTRFAQTVLARVGRWQLPTATGETFPPELPPKPQLPSARRRQKRSESYCGSIVALIRTPQKQPFCCVRLETKKKTEVLRGELTTAPSQKASLFCGGCYSEKPTPLPATKLTFCGVRGLYCDTLGPSFPNELPWRRL